MRPRPIRERMDVALAHGPLNYHDLALAVFPPREWPRAWRCCSHGGPPGCYMALSSAIRRHGYGWEYESRFKRNVYPRTAR
jgi:hypothetical protein